MTYEVADWLKSNEDPAWWLDEGDKRKLRKAIVIFVYVAQRDFMPIRTFAHLHLANERWNDAIILGETAGEMHSSK